MPDANVGDSVVRTITKRITLKKPTAQTEVGWDALVHFTGDLNNSLMSLGGFIYDVPTAATDIGAAPVIQAYPFSGSYAPTRFGGIVCSAGPVGSDLSNDVPSAILAPFYEGLDPLSTTSAGNSVLPKGGYRLVSGSIEAYNTTPELYRAGAVTGYELQNKEAFLTMGTWYSNTGTDYAMSPMFIAPRAPASIAQAVQLPGSVTHEAEKGAYLPLPLNVDSPMNYARFSMKAYAFRGDSSSSDQTMVTYPLNGGSLANSGAIAQKGNWDLPSTCNPAGLYFTGLSDQTTIDIVARFVIEEFPSVNDIRYLTLANPSPPRDAAALKAYGLIRSELPIMVPVAWNGLGTWLKSAMKVAKKVIPVVKSVAKVVPGVKQAVEVGEAVAGAAKQVVKSATKSKKTK
jgi:hypothetical protein